MRLAPVLLVTLAACSVGPGGSFPDTGGAAATTVSSTAPAEGTTTGDDGDGTSGGSTGSSHADSGSSDADTSGGDASASSATVSTTTTDATTGGSESGGGTPLDPQLDIPDAGEHCDYPGDLQSCPGIAVCRFATAEYGICESCDACGNLNAACVQGTDCDILFSCYAGHCTNFCTLGTFECGPVEACLDIGHPTRGVCDPFA